MSLICACPSSFHCSDSQIKPLLCSGLPMEISVNPKYVNEDSNKKYKVYENWIELIFTCTHHIKYYIVFN